jgi:hypothetical protein
MNILSGNLPEAVEIDGREYPINSDFRACLKIILAFEDPGLTALEKYGITLENLYPEIPENTEQALKLAIKFLNGGDEMDTEEEEGESPPRLYSFTNDGNYIFAAFRQTHGVDLETAQMHWWKFLALFMDLGSETTFCSIVGLRSRVRKGTATKEEMREYRDNKELFEVPEVDTRSLEERMQEEEFMRLVTQK